MLLINSFDEEGKFYAGKPVINRINPLVNAKTHESLHKFQIKPRFPDMFMEMPVKPSN